MEEDIQNIKQFKNIDEAIKVYKEFRRFKNDGFIESIDPDFFFNLMDYLLENSIPTSVIKEKIKEIEDKNYNNYTNLQDGNEVKYRILNEFKEILEERRVIHKWI